MQLQRRLPRRRRRRPLRQRPHARRRRALHRRVAVAVVYFGVAKHYPPDQTAHTVARADPRHRPRRIAGGRNPFDLIPRQSPNLRVVVIPGHRRRGVAGQNRAGVLPDQPPYSHTPGRPGDGAPLDIDAGGLPGGPPRQRPNAIPRAGHIRIDNPQIPDHPPTVNRGEQPGVAEGIVDPQPRYGKSLAIENPGESLPELPHRIPPREVVPAAHRPVPIGVEIQIRRQFIPRAYPPRTPHQRAAGGIPRRKRPAIRQRIGRRRRPVPVQIVPDPIQLDQRININQPIIVQIVIHPNRRPHRRIPQYRISRRRPKIPSEIRDIIPIHIHRPTRIYPHILRLPLQLRPRLPLHRNIRPRRLIPGARRRSPHHRHIAIAMRNVGRIPAHPPHQPPNGRAAPRPRHRPRRIAGPDRPPRRLPHQTAHRHIIVTPVES